MYAVEEGYVFGKIKIDIRPAPKPNSIGYRNNTIYVLK